jgi:hypothetical protein
MVFLYEFYAADGTELYVGISGQSWQRVNQHRRQSYWFGDVARVAWTQYLLWSEAEAAELAVLRAGRPVHNRKVGRSGRRVMSS